MLRLRTQSSWFSLLAVACSASQEADYDSAQLAAYRSALPQESRLAVELPAGETAPNALTQRNSAELARTGVRFARDVNTPAVLMVRTLRRIVELPPTLFDSVKREFVWGPWENDDGVGEVLFYIRENEAGADFQYSYALVRTMNGDVADATPVIWGGGTPEQFAADGGTGITLWDLEANNAFDAEHDPDALGPGSRGSGRFVMLYGERSENERRAQFNVAVFRNFRSDEEPAKPAADVDYFYGRVVDAQNVVDFFDSEIRTDLCDATPDHCFENDAVADLDEALEFHAVFLNRGIGRAEATLSEGDLEAPVSVVECWDPLFARTLLRIESGGSVVSETGTCTAPMDRPMSELGLPRLADIDAELLSALDCAAQRGVGACPER